MLLHKLLHLVADEMVLEDKCCMKRHVQDTARYKYKPICCVSLTHRLLFYMDMGETLEKTKHSQ